MGQLTAKDIKEQSLRCYGQWKDLWHANAKFHADRFEMKSIGEYHQSGVGKAALLIANGYSFEKKIDVIREYQDDVDIFVCDKTLGHCLDHGIIPDFCIVSDASVDPDIYLKPWAEKLADTVFLGNICAETNWAALGNWKDIYFFVQNDSIKTERIFIPMTKCPNVVVAGTNVSNAMLIVVTQCDNYGKKNFFGYDKLLTIGFDYSWQDNYYAFNADGSGKINYMRHAYLLNHRGELAFTSNNLLFSVKWANSYVKKFDLNVVDCDLGGIFQGKKNTDDLAGQMQYGYRLQDCHLMRKLVRLHSDLQTQLRDAEKKIYAIATDHKNAVAASM